MIPVRLKMRNFMCYRDNAGELEFTGIHIACLSGDNGNGKSAIIDAMTWALWGKARAGSDDDLIHSSEAEMEVEFDFALGTQIYRVIRKRTRPKKVGGAGQSSFDLMIAGDDGFRVVSGNSITQTQKKIIDEILHMDYDTFINSAYLRQGHADEFTRQTPSKRKEVLSNILGISLYDELEDRAKEMSRRREIEKVQLENTIREYSDEIAQKPVYEVEVEQAQSTLAGVNAQLTEKESGLNELRIKKEALEIKKNQLDELVIRIETGTRDLQRWEEQAVQHRDRITKYESIIARCTAIEEGYARYVEIKKLNDELYDKSQKSRKLESRKAQLEATLQKMTHELNTEHTVIGREITNLESKARELPELRNRLTMVQAEIRQLAESEKILREKEDVVGGLKKRINNLEAENTRLQREIGELTEKLDLLTPHTESHSEARCPLCESELTQEGLKLIGSKYTVEKKDKSELLTSNQEELVKKMADLEVLQQEKLQLEAGQTREKTKLLSQEETIKNRMKEIDKDSQKVTELRETLSEIEQRLTSMDYARTEQTALSEIENELSKLDYDPEKHEQARQQMIELESCEREKNSLDEAERQIDQEKEAAARAGEASGGIRKSLKLDSERKEILTTELTRLPHLQQELATVEAEYRQLATHRSQVQETLGSIKAKLERCIELEARKKEKEGQLDVVARDESVYRELARSFGKTGIQALLIEMALPDIESEANSLLARMTDNRMHVNFETQRATKKGTVQETLDITIADELGTRDYEMFSGGEAFRINFAIRIALSRLLAKRAGAPLPTLIIDEGFGTQDNTGLEKIKEAINSVQNDFDKILVITHMDDLKDAFPVRIDVEKTAEGSIITVN